MLYPLKKRKQKATLPPPPPYPFSTDQYSGGGWPNLVPRFQCVKCYKIYMLFNSINNLISQIVQSHSRRPKGNQSGREKRRDESFQARAEEPFFCSCLETFVALFLPARLTVSGSPRMVPAGLSRNKITQD